MLFLLPSVVFVPNDVIWNFHLYCNTELKLSRLFAVLVLVVRSWVVNNCIFLPSTHFSILYSILLGSDVADATWSLRQGQTPSRRGWTLSGRGWTRSGRGRTLSRRNATPPGRNVTPRVDFRLRLGLPK